MTPINLQTLKQDWIQMLEAAKNFIQLAPPNDIGCLYYSLEEKKFIQPEQFPTPSTIATHFPKPGGILPAIKPFNS